MVQEAEDYLFLDLEEDSQIQEIEKDFQEEKEEDRMS